MMKEHIHFVGFRGDEYHSAVRVWGKPDFFHRVFDDRVSHGDVDWEKDTVIFAKGFLYKKPTKYTFDDSGVF